MDIHKHFLLMPCPWYIFSSNEVSQLGSDPPCQTLELVARQSKKTGRLRPAMMLGRNPSNDTVAAARATQQATTPSPVWRWLHKRRHPVLD